MTITSKSEARHAGAFLLNEAHGSRSRDSIVIAISQTVKVGQVLGRIVANTGTITVAAATFRVGNTGNGTVTLASPAYGAGVKEGRYTGKAVTSATDAGVFVFEDVDGVIAFVATVGTPVDNVLKLTVNDGSTDWAKDDTIYVDVSIADAATLAQHKVLAPAAVDGTQHAAAIAIYAVTTGGSATEKIAAITRDAEVIGAELEWPVGITADEKAAAVSELAAAGIIVR